MRNTLSKRMKLIEDRLYHYDKRIFQDYTPSTPKDTSNVFPNGLTMSSFDEDFYDMDYHNRLAFEYELVRVQSGLPITDNEIDSVNTYINDGYKYINGSIYGTRFWNELNSDEKEVWRGKLPSIKKGLDSAISKTDGLIANMKLFHAGYWDISLEPGDEFQLKGYTSFSFRENSARSFMLGKHNLSDMDKWLMVACVPRGVKGLAVEGNIFSNVPNEHEYLVGRGQKGTVLDYDEDKHIVYVLLGAQ